MYKNGSKPEKELITLRNKTSRDIVMKGTSIFFGYQEYCIPANGVGEVESGLFHSYQCQVHIGTGELEYVEKNEQLPPAA